MPALAAAASCDNVFEYLNSACCCRFVHVIARLKLPPYDTLDGNSKQVKSAQTPVLMPGYSMKGDPIDAARISIRSTSDAFLAYSVFTGWLDACTQFWGSATGRRQADIQIVAHQDVNDEAYEQET